MPARVLRILLPFCLAVSLTAGLQPVLAQSGDPDKAKQQAPDPKKESKPRADDLNEASKQVAGPAGNPECVWLGRRVVNLLWRDDLDTAFRHLDLYDRFGCPGGHIQATFRCVVRQGNIDPKAPETLSARVHACWINPASPPAPAAAANPNPQPGTTTQ
jgi:hypothetical protein